MLSLVLYTCEGPPESSVALSNPGATPYESWLIGSWHAPVPEGTDPQSGGGTETLDISAGEDPFTLVIAFPWKEEQIRTTAFASKVGGEIYYNIRRDTYTGKNWTSGEEPTTYLIYKVDLFSDRSISLRYLNNRIITQLQEKGEVSGHEIRYGGWGGGSSQILDISRSQLVRLILKIGPGRLFQRFPIPLQSADTARPDAESVTNLFDASVNIEIHVVKRLLNQGILPDVLSFTSNSSIEKFTGSYTHLEPDLCDQKVKTGQEDRFMITALHLAAAHGNTKVAELLLNHGANPNATDNPDAYDTSARRSQHQLSDFG